jgi:hypothetical protein
VLFFSHGGKMQSAPGRLQDARGIGREKNLVQSSRKAGKRGSSVDLVAGEPSDGTPTLSSPRSAAIPKPVERFPVSGWKSGVERRVAPMARTQ